MAAIDRYRPNTASDRSPLRNLLDFESINDTAEKAGGDIKGAIEAALDPVVDFIFETTGLDLSKLAAALAGIDITNPGSILASMNAIAGGIMDLLQQIVDRIFGGLGGGTSTGNPIEALTTILRSLQEAVTTAVNQSQNVFGIVTQFGGVLHQLVDDLLDPPDYLDADDFISQIGTVSGTLVGTAFGAAADLLAGFAGMFNIWFGGSTAAGVPAEAIATVESIRVLTKDGYTLQTFTSSNPSWTVPPDLAAAEVAWAGVIGGGGKGSTGAVVGSTVAYASGGLGGVDGGYTLAPISPASLAPTLAVVIGAAATTAGANGGATSISSGGSPLATSTPGVSGIATPEGYQATSSKPGSGGNGGLGFTVSGNQAAADPGTPGQPSATAAGGAGGNGANGSSGASGMTGGVPITGGSGGGGGAGRTGFGLTGFSGGNGGYPGGGSGGGGGVGSTGGGGAGGPGGTPAAGFAFLIWK